MDSKKHSCECCAYTTSRKSSINKHLLTAKHLARTKLINIEQKSGAGQTYTCKKCNKTYKARNSLWYHEKKCVINEDKTLSNLVIELIKNNKDLQKQMIDILLKN
jgi:hypothetical protein